jgi:hypothetical protein
VPLEPEVPDVPEVPLEPLVPEVPSNPLVPDVPLVPDGVNAKLAVTAYEDVPCKEPVIAPEDTCKLPTKSKPPDVIVTMFVYGCEETLNTWPVERVSSTS